MGNTTGKYETYQQQYEKMKNSNNSDKLDLASLDPYKVLNVPKNFTWNQLKEAYKEVAIQTHPDKGGNKVIFDFVTQCFKTLAEEYKMRKQDKVHHELKEESADYFEKIVNNNVPHPSTIMDTNEPFAKRFNKVFDECKYTEEDVEYGYGKIMSKSGLREDISIENVFKKDKVDNSTFNEVFDKNVPCSKSVITKYKVPEPLLMVKNLQYAEIGSKRPDDYSSGIEKKDLTYTDYMKAYDGSRLANPEDIKKIKSFKSVKEYEVYRDNKIKKTLTDKEKKELEKQKELEERKEWERQERIKKQNKEIQMAFERANRLLIK